MISVATDSKYYMNTEPVWPVGAHSLRESEHYWEQNYFNLSWFIYKPEIDIETDECCHGLLSTKYGMVV
jgi:hypothetical protein